MTKLASILIAATVLGFSGCGNAPAGGAKGEPVAAASGVVKYKGEPMKDVQITFYPQGGKGNPGRGKTTENGRFIISTYGSNDGAVVGTHVVTAELMPVGAMPGRESEAAGGRTIPKKYAQQNTSPLSFTVKSGEPNDFEIKLDD